MWPSESKVYWSVNQNLSFCALSVGFILIVQCTSSKYYKQNTVSLSVIGVLLHCITDMIQKVYLLLLGRDVARSSQRR